MPPAAFMASIMPSSTRTPLSKPATLADIGRAVGVSAMSASAVLNGSRTSTRISAETRNKILEEAARLRYRPNAAARALNRRKMNTLGLAGIIDSGEINAYFLEVMNGVLEAAGRFNQNVTVFTLHDWKVDAGRIADFCDGRIDGLILLAPVINKTKPDLIPSHTPFVSLHANHPIPGVTNIESDEEQGALDIVNLLLAQGHRHILHVSGPSSMLGARRRQNGYQRALAAYATEGIVPEILEAGFSAAEAADALKTWMKKRRGQPLPTALFCANDSAALGCIELLAGAGLRVPHDISVVGFDDTLAARTSVPQLTTVRQPLRAMGGKAVELLLGIDPSQSNLGNIVFPTQSVARASVSAPPVKTVAIPRLVG